MSTIFKVGMKVYDQIVFPNKEGVIAEIGKGTVCPLIVKVEDIYLYYKLNGAFGTGIIPTLSIKPYKIDFQGFEQRTSIPNFEDVWDRKEEVYTSPDYNENYSGYPSEELADAAEALRKLLFLIDYYNDGWTPDYNDNNRKFIIYVTNNEFEIDFSIAESNILTFKSEDIRDKFFEEQKELLEIAKPLL